MSFWYKVEEEEEPIDWIDWEWEQPLWHFVEMDWQKENPWIFKQRSRLAFDVLTEFRGWFRDAKPRYSEAPPPEPPTKVKPPVVEEEEELYLMEDVPRSQEKPQAPKPTRKSSIRFNCTI